MLTPVEIKKQEFRRSVRGYDKAEVRSFLDTVADDFKKIAAIAQLQAAEIERLKTELVTFRQMEQNMKEALVNTQETLREAREGSLRNADLASREAKLTAERIVQEAHKKGNEIRRDIEMLEVRRDSFVRKLKILLRSEWELIALLEDENLSAGQVIPNNPVQADDDSEVTVER